MNFYLIYRFSESSEAKFITMQDLPPFGGGDYLLILPQAKINKIGTMDTTKKRRLQVIALHSDVMAGKIIISFHVVAC